MFQRLSYSVAFVGALAMGLVACSPETPKLVPRPEVKKERVRNVGTRVSFNPRVDIMFVVDDSGSMSTHQQNLSKNIQLFTAGIQSNQILDYNIGVITTSMDSFGRTRGGGQLVGTPTYVSRSTPGGMQTLARNLLVGTDGSGQEQFFGPLMAALTPPLITGGNAGFYRSDAYLVTVFITDTDDQTENLQADQVYASLLNMKSGDKEKIITYGVFIPSVDRNCDRSGEEEPRKLERWFTLSGGKTLGLCDPDYGQKLAAIGDDLAERVGKTMYLSRPPDPNTISVQYGTQVIPNDAAQGWVYDPVRNALVFGDQIEWVPQAPGSQVEVDFTSAVY